MHYSYFQVHLPVLYLYDMEYEMHTSLGLVPNGTRDELLKAVAEAQRSNRDFILAPLYFLATPIGLLWLSLCIDSVQSGSREKIVPSTSATAYHSRTRDWSSPC